MNDPSYYKYYKEMMDNDIDLAFKGPFSHEILLSLADTLLGTISKENETQRIPRKVFAIFVELTQNIRDYSAERKIFNDKEVGTGIIVMKDNPENYRILSGNVVKKQDSVKIAEYVEQLNSLDKAGLKSLFQEKLSAGESKNNGGVGLITIARKSENKFEIKMEQIDEEHYFFVLMTTINKEI